MEGGAKPAGGVRAGRGGKEAAVMGRRWANGRVRGELRVRERGQVCGEGGGGVGWFAHFLVRVPTTLATAKP